MKFTWVKPIDNISVTSPLQIQHLDLYCYIYLFLKFTAIDNSYFDLFPFSFADVTPITDPFVVFEAQDCGVKLRQEKITLVFKVLFQCTYLYVRFWMYVFLFYCLMCCFWFEFIVFTVQIEMPLLLVYLFFSVRVLVVHTTTLIAWNLQSSSLHRKYSTLFVWYLKISIYF